MNTLRALAGALVLALLASNCSSAKTSSSTSGGVVPADMRDVERDGEGLVVTTFGAFPDRVPDWQRAGSVLGLLKEVWSRSKTANPGLPAPEARSLDEAITSLDTALAAKDQKAAAYASNQVGLAVPKLFDFFHPDSPLGVVRMDAVFRQIGLDAHFGDASAALADLASLQSDWMNTQAAVDARGPTCHRVGGTATVSGDITQSLAVFDAALRAANLKMVEQESENGAIEVDTLELLFDCPAGTAAPSTGLGSRCSAATSCGAALVCDLTSSGGTCAPDPANAKIGTACNSTVDCGSDSRAACNTEAGDNYPGGYCGMEPCDDVQVCPAGATCVSLGGETPGCFQSCASDTDCRQAEGYVCQLFSTLPPAGFGPSDHACAFACTRDADCHMPLKCDVASGKCNP